MIERIITSEKGTGARRWELPDIHAPLADQASDPEPSAPETEAEDEALDSAPGLPTADRIMDIERQAREEGLRAGQEEGRRLGLEQGRKEGFAKGQADGLKAAEAAVKERLALLDHLIQGLEQPYAALDAAVEDELVQLAMAVARQLVRRELKTDPGAIVAVLREALEALPSAERKLHLHLHPDDSKLVRETLRLDDLERPWSIVEDPTLSRGGVRVITETSRVDATLESRLNAVIASVWGGERSTDQGGGGGDD
ncbi:flagellar assembly protein FliH [Ectothiorhodospira shaposhnikovii]|uniref:flagellar assembly protein FliH n=1 Tax=Ectothiorhodospira shaposhnikovii TaxID=1054 RepID=UPI001EE99B23|nr:flagellar assembly protein FliH [Ectothiorhodospira shaposhnikovii]MCG5514209.1 flagellar assembly protein FliH [Ectothiorhodospira shaposhnikovii]